MNCSFNQLVIIHILTLAVRYGRPNSTRSKIAAIKLNDRGRVAKIRIDSEQTPSSKIFAYTLPIVQCSIKVGLLKAWVAEIVVLTPFVAK